MRIALGILLAFTATTAVAATDPRTVPTQLSPEWQAKARDVFKQAIEIPTVHHRGQMHRMASLLAEQFKAAGIPAADAEPEGLYPSGDGSFEFQRTVSRIEEMRSAEYLAQGHGTG